MRSAVLFGIGVCAAVAFAPAARATTYAPEQFTCPVGGEKFKAMVVASNSTFGARPDGKPYSPLPVYPLVECPGNGFLLFDEKFAPAELERLKAAVASQEFQAMRRTEAQYYRAWWLMQRAGREPFSLAGTLLQASWEVDDAPADKARYQALFAEAAMSLEGRAGKEEDWFWLNLRAANALRELGRFEEARALLERVDKAELLPTEPDQREGARLLIDGLRSLVIESNRVAEPANLVPGPVARHRCEAGRLTASEIAACNRLKAEISSEKQSQPAEISAPTGAAAKAAREAALDAAQAAKDAMTSARHRDRKKSPR